MAREIFSYYKNSLISLISSVQKLNREPENNLQLCKEIQLSLVDRIFYIEKRIRILRTELETTKKNLHRKLDQPLTKDEARSLKAKIKTIEGNISDYHDLRKAYKSIGDAIAFTFIDKWSIKQFAQKEDVGFLSGKDGFRLEIETFRAGFSYGIISILHDLTNCLKHGDVSFIIEEKPILTLECKSRKGGSKRGNRQLSNIKEIYDFLQTDIKEVDGHKVFRTSLQNEEISYSNLVTKLIETSIEEGVSFQQIETGLYYLISTRSSNFDKLQGSFKSSSQIVVIVLNDMKFNSIGYMPFTLLIQNPEYVYKFYHGEFIICVLIDIEEIRNELKNQGISIELMESEGYIFRLYRSVDGLEYHISRYLFYRIANEFLSLSWFIQEMIEGFENPSKEILDYLKAGS